VTSTLINITFDCADPRALARFWGQVTGWPVITEPQPGYPDCAVGTTGADRPRLYFVAVPEGKAGKNRLHLDVMPADRTQDEEIARLIGLGASVVSDRRPELGWVTLADPEGNEFCVEISAAELAAAQAAEGAAGA
jgi:Glyoxalase-like domain